MAVYTIGDLIVRKCCGSIGIITAFDDFGDPYINFLTGDYEDLTYLEYASRIKHLEEKDL